MKKSTLIMQANNNEKRRESNTHSVLFDVRSFVLTLVISLSIITGSVAQFADLAFAATTHNAGSWADLKTIIEEASAGDTIIITNDVVATETLTIDKNLTIKGKAQAGNEDTYIYRAVNNADFPVFNVGAGGQLTLGDDLTLTGKSGTCQDVVADADKGFKVVYHNGGLEDAAQVTEPYTFTAGQNVIKDPATLTSANWGPPEEGLEFVEWEFYSHSGNATKKATETWKVPNNPPDGTMTLVAKWTRPVKREFKVTLSNGLEGEDEETKTVGPYTANTPLIFNLSDAEKEAWRPGSDYEFAGWQWPAFGGYDAGYSTSGDTGLTVPQNTYGTVTLVARWEKYSSSKSYDWSGCVQDGKLNPTPNYQWGSNRAFMISVMTAGSSVDSATWQQRFYAPYYGSTPYLKVGDLSVDGSTTFSELTWSVKLDGDSSDSSYTNYVHDNWNPLNHPEDDKFKTMMWEFVDYKEEPSGEYWYHIRSASNGKYLAMGDKHTEGYFKITLIDEEDLEAYGNEAYWNFASGNYGTYLKLKAHAGSNTAYYLQPADIYGGSSSTPNTGLRRTVPMLVWGTGHPINSMYWANITDNNNSPTGNYYDNGSAVGWEENTSNDFTDCDTKDNHEWAAAPKSQRCDGNQNTPVYSDTNPSGTTKFTSGTNVSGSSKIDTPKAFFVDVNSGGSLTIEGSNFEEFITDASVKNAAPITVTGGSTLTMNSGEIRNNKVGYGANNEADSQDNVQKLKQRLANDTVPTNTAGGLIVSDKDTKVYLNDSAKIKNNQADAGAIILKDDAMVIMNKSQDAIVAPTIEYNVGWHHSGGVLVENAATLHLIDGHIDNNVAWGKGGAVWATEFGTTGWVQWQKYPKQMTSKSVNDRNGRKGGNFIMDGGTLNGNFAFMRAGALEVESNGVFLNNGAINNNRCKSLGGAIYVEGDSPIYTFTLNIENGYIHNNTSHAAKPVDALDKRLSSEGELIDGDDYSTAKGGIHRDADWADWGQKHTGDGGGVWLCAMGGTSVFTSTTGDDTSARVVINGNTAAQDGDTAKNNGWGDDFYISHRYGSALVQNLVGTWYGDGESAEKGSTPIKTSDENGVIITGPKGMYSAGTIAAPSTGIRIENNQARNGGGIAANGTIILGKASSVYRYDAEFNFTKEWTDGLDGSGKEASFELRYTFNGNEYKLIPEASAGNNGVNEGDKQSKYEVTLGPTTSEAQDGNEVMYRVDQWTAKALIPGFTQHVLEETTTLPAGTVLNDGTILTETTQLPKDTVVSVPLFRIKKFDAADNDTSDAAYYNLAKKADVQALFEGINSRTGSENNGNVPLKIEWNIVVKEIGDDYTFTPGDTSATGSVSLKKEVKLIDPDTGKEIEQGKFSVNNSTLTFAQTGGNSPKTVNAEFTKVNTGANPVNGAKFWVYEAEYSNKDAIPIVNTKREVTSSAVDGNNGKVVINNLKVGTTYLVFEKTAAPGYKRVVDPWFIMINESGDKVVLKKLKSDKRLQYYQYQGNGQGDKTATETTDHTTDLTNKSWPTHNNWIETVSNNRLVNEPIVLKKVKKENISQPLAGVTFEMFSASNNGNEANGRTYYTDDSRKINVTIQSGPDGTIDLSEAIAAAQANPATQDTYYFLFEKTQPNGNYRLQTAPWLVVVTPSGTVSVKAYEDLYKTGPDVIKNGNRQWKHYYQSKFVDMTTKISGLKSNEIVNEWKSIELEKIGVGNAALNGGTFKLFKMNEQKHNGNTIADYIVDASYAVVSASAADGKLSLPIGAPGKYFLFEEDAPNGYVVPKDPWLIEVDANRNVKVYKNSQNPGKFWVAGVGNISDITVPDEYTVDYLNTPLKKWPTNWFETEITNKKLTNEKVRVELTKTKSDNARTTITNTATFALYEANVNPSAIFEAGGELKTGNISISRKNTTPVASQNTNNGVVTFDNVDTDKVYLIFETAAPEGYLKSKAPWMLYVKKDGTYRVFKSNSTNTSATSWAVSTFDTELTGANAGKLTNEPFDLWFVKGDIADSSVPINGATFDLYYAKKESGNYTANGEIAGAVSYSSDKYHVAVDLPESGTAYYLLFESKAQSGYMTPKTPWLIVLNEYGDYSIHSFTDTAAADFETAHANDTLDVLTTIEIPEASINTSGIAGNKLLNEKEQIKITKVRGNAHNDLTTDGVVGAKFEIFRTKIEDNRYVKDGTSIATLESKADGIITLPRVISATSGEKYYWLQETSAAPGYQLSDRPWLVKVNNGALQNVMIAGSAYVEGQGIGKVPNGNWDYITVYPKDYNSTPRIHNKPLKFKKVSASDSSRTLNNVTFGAYKVRNWVEIDYNKLSTIDWSEYTKNLRKDALVGNERVVSDQNGEFTFKFTEPGAYFIFEESVPDGYADNSKRPWLLIIKPDGNYQLRRHNGDTRNTDDENYNGYVNAAGIEWWTQKNFVKVGDNIDLVLENERKPIELYKVDEKKDANGKPAADAAKLGGASFKIVPVTLDNSGYYAVTDANDNATVSSFSGTVVNSAQDTGKITIDNLAAGDYFLFEVQAPTGFVRSTSPWIIKVSDTGSGRSWMVYAPKSGHEGLVDVGGGRTETVLAGTAPGNQKIGKRWWNKNWFEVIYNSSETASTPNEARLANAPKYITKVSLIGATGNKPTFLENAKFELYNAVITGDSVKKGNTKIAELESDENGRIYLPSAVTKIASDANGYFLIETEAPGGYQLSDKPWWITVDASGNITVKSTTQDPQDGDGWNKNDFSPITPKDGVTRITNAPNDLNLTKVDGYDNAGLEGAQFEILGASYVSNSGSNWVYRMDPTSNFGLTSESAAETGIFTLPNLPVTHTRFNANGTIYFMREVKAPEGYELSDEPWALIVRSSSATGWQTSWNVGEGAHDDNALYEIYLFKTHKTNTENVYSFTDNGGGANSDSTTVVKNYPSINLVKVDVTSVTVSADQEGCETITGDRFTALENVKFDIYKANNDDGWTKNGNTPIKSNIVSSSEELSKGVVELGALSPGRYLIYETQAKDRSYIIPDKPWRLEVGSDGKISRLHTWSGDSYVETAHNKYLTNSPAYDLPKSGGMGTYWFMIIGAMMMGFAITAGFTKMNLLKMIRR